MMQTIRIGMKLILLKRNGTRSKVQINKLQNKQLRKLLHHVWEHSTYYRQRLIEAGIDKAKLDTVELSALPTLSKAQLLEHFDELVTQPRLTQARLREFDRRTASAQDCLDNQFHVVHSSGSTQQPGYFVYDNRAWETMLAGILRGALWNMPLLKIARLIASRPKILYIAATDGRYGGAMAVSAGISGIQAQQLFLDIKTPLPVWIEKINAFQPTIVIGYPSALKILADLADQHQLNLALQRVISCGEPLSRNLRQYLQSRLGEPVINIYGASESLALGVECGSEEEMVLFDDLNIIEIKDGRLYLTCLYNTVQPLIRYEMTDQLILKDTRSPFTQASIELCRSEDLLWFERPDGQMDFLHPLALEGFCIEGLHDLQFLQKDARHFEVLCECGLTADQQHVEKELREQLNLLLAEKQLISVTFQIRFVNAIAPDPQTGKKKLILRKAVAA